MTHAEMIFDAANRLKNNGQTTFTREDIRKLLNIDQHEWSTSYSPIFQGMRCDHPGGAPQVPVQYRNSFRRINHGVYVLVENENKGNANPMVRSQLFYIDVTNRPHQKFQEKIDLILNNTETFHKAFYLEEPFGKPCLYYHLKALETNSEPASKRHIEYIYAMLIAWGMHRLGKGGSKMKGFEEFYQSIQKLEKEIKVAKDFKLETMDEDRWSLVQKIFKEIKVMESGTSIVGNSKVMHHILPNIIPPIDRKYTLSFLFGKTNIKNNLNEEWLITKNIIESFYIPLTTNIKIKKLSKEWMNNQDKFPWDTSILKIIDNLVVGAKRKK